MGMMVAEIEPILRGWRVRMGLGTRGGEQRRRKGGFRVRFEARHAVWRSNHRGGFDARRQTSGLIGVKEPAFLNKFRQAPGRRLGSRRPRGRLGRRRRRRGSGRRGERGERGGWAPSRRPVRSRRRRAGLSRRQTAGLAQARRRERRVRAATRRPSGRSQRTGP